MGVNKQGKTLKEEKRNPYPVTFDKYLSLLAKFVKNTSSLILSFGATSESLSNKSC